MIMLILARAPMLTRLILTFYETVLLMHFSSIRSGLKQNITGNLAFPDIAQEKEIERNEA